ncbi:MAG: tRNA lysidine(34) synthetase TilS [Candidatus Brocadiae bacterium]|nr:tRNA lysidine(34) synthetase TilS [Candidatus Brocadiia bacterium]
MDTYSVFYDFILKNKLLDHKEKILVGVSGGADSIALLDLMAQLSQQLSLEIVVACLDHGIREESQEEARWVGERAAQYGFPFCTKRIELGKESKTALEEKAREARYSFLWETAQRFQASKVAVAHHADDQVETILLHFLKGTGIPGLCGMPLVRSLFPHSTVCLIRPLLCLNKQQILFYLQQKGLSWREDVSNADIRFTRNRIRHKIIPFLEEQGYPKIKESLLHLTQYAKETNDYMRQQAENFYQNHVKECCPERPYLSQFFQLWEGKECAKTILNSSLQELPIALVPYLFYRICYSFQKPSAIRSSHYQRISKLIQEQQGMVEMPDKIEIHKTPSSMTIVFPCSTEHKHPCVWQIPGKVSCSPYSLFEAQCQSAQNFDLDSHRIHSHPLSVAIAADSLEFPFWIRSCSQEDTIQLLGSPGNKKIARILSDLKVPLPLRQRILLVTDNHNRPLWIPGVGISHFARIQEKTKNIVVLSMKKIK